MTEPTDGTAPRGRAVPPEPLETFTFPGTGRTVQIRKLSALFRDKVRAAVVKERPEPQPPLVEVDYGAGTIQEPHRGHPVYQQLLQAWRHEVDRAVNEKIVQLLIRRSIVCEIDQAAVDVARADLAAVDVDTSDQSDLEVYVCYVCVGPFADWTDLLKVVFERSAPTEAAIQAHSDSFSAELRG